MNICTLSSHESALASLSGTDVKIKIRNAEFVDRIVTTTRRNGVG